MLAGFTVEEFRARRRKFSEAMNAHHPGWSAAAFAETVNQFYFTGTMQDGILFIINDPALPEKSRLLYGVRRSFARAKMESPLFSAENVPAQNAAVSGAADCGAADCGGANYGGAIRGAVTGNEITANAAHGETMIPMNSYRDLAAESLAAPFSAGPGASVFAEGDTMPLAMLDRLKKYFPAFSAPRFLDTEIRALRAVKSEAELAIIRESGAAHRKLLEEKVPGLLRENMSEAEFLGELTLEMYRSGWQGLNRFHQRECEIAAGQIGFGENSLYPARFDGPGGSKGYGPASPLSADPARRLKKGDAVFVDTGFSVAGYHSDKTQVYFFGAEPPEEYKKAQQFCIDVQKRAAEMLRPGGVPSKIYETILAAVDGKTAHNFMGVDAAHRVKFLGHGVGLNIDELPVIAKGFDAPLEAGMVISLEPKMAVPGVALAGVEDTYIVTAHGGECVTGGGRDIIRVQP